MRTALTPEAGFSARLACLGRAIWPLSKANCADRSAPRRSGCRATKQRRTPREERAALAVRLDRNRPRRCTTMRSYASGRPSCAAVLTGRWWRGWRAHLSDGRMTTAGVRMQYSRDECHPYVAPHSQIDIRRSPIESVHHLPKEGRRIGVVLADALFAVFPVLALLEFVGAEATDVGGRGRRFVAVIAVFVRRGRLVATGA